MNIVTAAPRFSAMALTLAIGAVLAMAAAPEANASVDTPTNGAAACKALSSAGQSAFYLNNFYIRNGSTSNQYLACFMPTWNLEYVGNAALTSLFWSAGATGGTIICTAQSGFYFSFTTVAQGNTQSRTLAANASVQMDFPALSRNTFFYTVNMICNVPPGFKLGLIVPYDSNPPSGFGWVP